MRRIAEPHWIKHSHLFDPDVRNIGSNKVMEKCGFIKEGTEPHTKQTNW